MKVGFILWLLVHVMLVMWVVKSSRQKKQEDITQVVNDIREKPFSALYLFTVIIAIEIFVLGILSPTLFSFDVETPFGNYESWFLALLYGVIWWFLGLFYNK
ncbi:hypothetical protein R7F09_04680 [Vibrio sp. Vb2532]|nr:hypothetical protein [Vibrio sp. Vb2532]